ncbi:MULTISPECIES: cell division inhibitor SulA [unclassified Shewanella]|uniref:cell division inhibitor SulA n=1 Tax=unclassified Shewanella TaxID=196818 RepID=UPI001BBC9C71|nr:MULTISPECIES: SulA-like leucine-rich domain-containing protein [unclassified Shewanella]GIU21071.1 cell division inhibitor SulA [Shewanella sp. MBTL60-112-B1]GIU40363.1 cell division inhibitor SulA [Shewanella sp. MBTL60-112-B2]
MNKLLGVSPRHPGLWQDIPSTSISANSGNEITSMVSHTQGRDELTQICAQLSQLSQQGRWIVLISPPNIGYKQMLAAAGVRMDRILLVHAKDEVETLWAMEKALTSGTSSAVITWTNSLDARDSRRLQIVAKSARAAGIIIENANGNTIENGSRHLLDNSVSAQDCSFTQTSLFSAIH